MLRSCDFQNVYFCCIQPDVHSVEMLCWFSGSSIAVGVPSIFYILREWMELRVHPVRSSIDAQR